MLAAVWVRAGCGEESGGAALEEGVAKGSPEDEEEVEKEVSVEVGKGQVDEFACICRAASRSKLASDLASSSAGSVDTRWLFWGGPATSANGNGVDGEEGEGGVIDGEPSKSASDFASSSAAALPQHLPDSHW